MTSEEARRKALSLLEKRDYGRDELVSKLVEKGAEAPDAEAAADKMVEYGFVNDEKYAGMVVRHYAAKGYGAARVREELRRRRLPRELWDAALGQMPDNSDAAAAILAQKLRGRGADRDALRRAMSALVRRGFSWDEARRAADSYLAEMELDE